MKTGGLFAAIALSFFATGAYANEGSCFNVIDVPANNGIPGMSQFELIPCDAGSSTAIHVPEPSSLAIFAAALGLAALFVWRRRIRDVKTVRIE
jgi:hypothetical protein